jgi:hypothetical protein
MTDIQFLFDNQLIAALEKLIKDAKHKLFLVSPFIDLDNRIQDALREKIERHDFELLVLFGKNENNYYKSMKKDSFEFLKQFPNIEIRHNDRLHAKFYQNDFNYIMTSLNLYNYSLANNIEVGIIGKHASKGLLGKVLDGSDALVAHGIDKVGQDIFGFGKEVNPFEKFETIFKDSELKYKTEPIITDQGGIKGVFGGKKLEGKKVIVDNLTSSSKEKDVATHENSNNFPKPSTATFSNISSKTLSASQLSKTLGVSQTDITNLMQKFGLITGDKITEVGKSKGLTMKNYMGKDYIAYPDNLAELNELKK